MVTKEKKVFFLYTILIAVLVIVGFSLLYIYKSKENYYFVVRVYNVIEYSLLAYFFSFYIRNNSIKKILLFSVFVFIIFCIYNFIHARLPRMPFIPASVENILLLLLTTYYFFEEMQAPVFEPIYEKAIFWICVAFIVNSSGNFFLFLYSKNSFNDEAFKTQYTIIYTTVTIVKNLLLCISIFINNKHENSTSNSNGFLDINLDTIQPIKNQS